MRTLAVLAISLISVGAQAALPTGRSLPRGETPRTIIGTFISQAGEVHFLEEKGIQGSAVLRTPKGAIFELVRTEGPRECDRFGTAAVAGCSFFFSDGSDGIEVRSQDLKEQDLFHAVSLSLQARARHVSL